MKNRRLWNSTARGPLLSVLAKGGSGNEAGTCAAGPLAYASCDNGKGYTKLRLEKSATGFVAATARWKHVCLVTLNPHIAPSVAADGVLYVACTGTMKKGFPGSRGPAEAAYCCRTRAQHGQGRNYIFGLCSRRVGD